jgi:RNA-directed DNA polymerase
LWRIAQPDNLRLAAWKALRGRRDRPQAVEFVRDLNQRLDRLARGLLSESVEVGRFRQFVIHDPKERLITAPCLEERVLHHAIMNVCEPDFERWLIDDTFACRPGRGRIAALGRAQDFSRRFPAVLKLDVRRYFDTVPHAELLAALESRFKDAPLLRLWARIIASYRGDRGRGLPIGALLSQHFANFYLGRWDRHVKETLRVRGYVRYMDDMLLWGSDPRGLWRLRERAETFFRAELGLELKPGVAVRWSRQAIGFLGCRVAPTHLTLNRASRLRFGRNLRRLESRWLAGELPLDELIQRMESLLAFTRAGGVRSWKFRRSVLQRRRVDGDEREPGHPGRELEQQPQQRPVREPQQEHARQPEQQPGSAAPPSSAGSPK